MALPVSATKPIHVTLSGTCWQGGEGWQTGFFLGDVSNDSVTPTQAAADAIRDAWVTFFSHADANIHSSFKFDTVKLALLNENGLYAGEAVESHPAGVVSGGAIASTPMPPQVALVATLVAGSGKGLAGKGRMYLPGVNAAIDGTGHIIAPAPQKIADKLAGFFNAINAHASVPDRVINVSRGHKITPSGAGDVTYTDPRNVPVNGVRVGNVYDTQRRRRNALVETYFPSTVADS